MSEICNADTLLQRRAKEKLPEQAYVTLSEALSWLAFGMALKSEALATALEFGSPDKIGEARLYLRETVDRLADTASSGRIEMRGKFVSHDGSEGKTRSIPPEEFHDFARFDVFCDGLNPGRGLAWRYSAEGLDKGMNDRPEEAYRLVKVRRDELLENAGKGKRAPAYKRGPSPSDEEILVKADEMKLRGMTSYEIASQMRHEPGFENVATTRVRELIKGRYPRGPREWRPLQEAHMQK